jgi:hypothetical protein
MEDGQEPEVFVVENLLLSWRNIFHGGRLAEPVLMQVEQKEGLQVHIRRMGV